MGDNQKRKIRYSLTMQRITSVTPTICKLMGIEPPSLSTEEAIEDVLEKTMGSTPISRCLVYAPDAIGEYLYRDFRDDFLAVEELAPISVLLSSVYPTVTPVCFGSMFTGALPEAHGIVKYDKPVLRCDTIFDALLRAGKRVAIVAVEGSSIAKIFLDRDLDYFIEEDDAEVNEKTLEVIEDGHHDFILAYNQDYDDNIHALTPRAPEAIDAMRNHIRDFQRLAERFLERHRDEARLVVFSPDHGVHLDEETGRGSHGLDTPEDLEVRNFWGIYPSEE